MKKLKSRICFLPLLAVPFLPVAAQAEEGGDTETMMELWDTLARQHVKEGQIGDVTLTVVDYSAISADPDWKELLTLVEKEPVPTTRDEQLAYWINAYNIMAINVVLSEYPVDSIKDAGGLITSVWDIDAGVVGGETRTLTEIEHKILRPMGEPRIHAAINCASVSCPPLRNEAFVAEKLDDQLEEQMTTWLSDKNIGLRIEENGETLRLSKIFDWFGEDFEKNGRGVLDYVEQYMSPAQKEALSSSVDIKYLDYDWTLNDAKRASFAD